ncbi:MAG: glutamate synthase subunit beta [Spirochaetales bacterium]|nr:glutamate synthase subunit beta [Spirochaetales bacterium]
MGKTLGFLETMRKAQQYRDVSERLQDYKEVAVSMSNKDLIDQGGRCMECGTPFCHNLGCPLGNLIPEWNDAVYRNQWKEAWERMELTNNFPEFTGRICPAICETSCTLSINDAPVTIRNIEWEIAETAWREGWVKVRKPKVETGMSVAVIGSGPAGMAAAQELRRMGHKVTLFEKNNKIGGLLRYGIPDFKLDKSVIDRRVEQMRAEGVEFETGVTIGDDISIRYLKNKFDAVLITIGAGKARDLPVKGRNLKGIHFALDYLSQSNKNVAEESYDEPVINAMGKKVLVIGGGDTGSDCVGTANRQGAVSVHQFEIMPKPLEWDKSYNPQWPDWPQILRTSSSHKEGCFRDWCVTTNEFIGKKGSVTKGTFQKVEWVPGDKGRPRLKPVEGTEFELEVDLVLLAMGFEHVEHNGIVNNNTGLNLTDRGNIAVDENFMTNIDGIFAAGDANVGASLVVHAINYGRKASNCIHDYLMKRVEEKTS